MGCLYHKYSHNWTERKQTMHYHTPQVRHLAWSLFSPPMATLPEAPSFSVEPDKATLEWLKALDEDPSALLDYLSSQNSRLLGSYFECLCQFFFSHGPHWQLLGHHIQVHDGQHTLGELDLVACHNASQTTQHIELAVKFYLFDAHSSDTGLHQYLGPQSHDRLDLKLNKLAQKQLPFLQDPHTQARLTQLNIPHPTQQQLVLKGYLFYPLDQALHSHHTAIHPDCPTGTWLHQMHSQEVLKQDALWAILPKHEWLGPYTCSQNPQTIALLNSTQAQTAIKQHFELSDYPHALMLVKLEQQDSDYHETERFMLVHDQWPTPVKRRTQG